jgi:hypothetical protein
MDHYQNMRPGLRGYIYICKRQLRKQVTFQKWNDKKLTYKPVFLNARRHTETESATPNNELSTTNKTNSIRRVGASCWL